MRKLVIAVLVLLALVACGSSEEGLVKANPGRVFTPKEMTMAVGETVTWEIDGDEAHTVTAYDDGVPEGGTYFASGGFDSEEAALDDIAGGLLEAGETYEVTFDEPGTYRYYCIPHEADGMVGTIVVE